MESRNVYIRHTMVASKFYICGALGQKCIKPGVLCWSYIYRANTLLSISLTIESKYFVLHFIDCKVVNKISIFKIPISYKILFGLHINVRKYTFFHKKKLSFFLFKIEFKIWSRIYMFFPPQANSVALPLRIHKIIRG